MNAGLQRSARDTASLRTYTVSMNVTLSIDEQTVARTRRTARALRKSRNQLIRDYLETLAGGDDPERSNLVQPMQVDPGQ